MIIGTPVSENLHNPGSLDSDHAHVFHDVSVSKPLFRRVAEQLIGAIEADHYPVGSMLPKEKELAEAFGVSRSSVREALSCLQFEGYVETRQGSGTVVISKVDRASYVTQHVSDFSGCGAIDIMEARLMIEPEVIAIASREPVASELRVLKRILFGMERDVDGSEHGHSDLVVHGALVRVCSNQLLVRTAESLLSASNGDAFRVARAQSWEDPIIPKEWLIHHQTIVTAVVQRDPIGAKRAYTEHLVSVLDQLRKSAVLSVGERSRADYLMERYRVEG